MRCWSCDEPVFAHAVRCRYCGAELSPQARQVREDRGALYNPERRRNRRDYRSDGRGPTRPDGPPPREGFGRRPDDLPEAAAPWDDADFERISRDAGAATDERDLASEAGPLGDSPDWGDSDFERISQTAGPAGNPTPRRRAAARRPEPDPAPPHENQREARRASGPARPDRPADRPSGREEPRRGTFEEETARGGRATGGTGHPAYARPRQPEGDPGSVRPLHIDPVEMPHEPELPPEPETVAGLEMPPESGDAEEEAQLYGVPVDDDPIEVGPVEGIRWQEPILDDTRWREPVYEATLEEPEPEEYEPERLRGEPTFERPPRHGPRYDGPVLEARLEDRARPEDRIHIRPAVGVGPARPVARPRTRIRFLGGVAVGVMLTVVVAGGWAAGWWDRSAQLADWLATGDTAKVGTEPGTGGGNPGAAAPDQSSGGIDVPVRPGDRLASVKEKYGSNVTDSAGPASPVGSDETAAVWRQWTVRDVQRALAGLGYYDGEVDGLVGPLTRGAVRAFQREVGLEPTGHIQPPVIEAIARAESRTTR